MTVLIKNKNLTKTLFSKINFLPLKQGKNTYFLKNYGISVQIFVKK